MLTSGITIEHLTVLLQHPEQYVLTDHHLIMFNMPLGYVLPVLYYSRCLSDKTTADFTIKILSALAPVLTSGAVEGSSTNPTHVLTDSVINVLHLTLDSIAPLKKKIRKQKRPAQWYTAQTQALKQMT